jgi:hypothetical protein
VYSPIGTARKENCPALSVLVVRENDDEPESNVTFAAAIARSCGSRTVPLTSPKTDARAAAKERTIKMKLDRTRLRFITPPLLTKTLLTVLAACVSNVAPTEEAVDVSQQRSLPQA